MRYAQTALMPRGRIEEAVRELELALELDPLAIYTRLWFAVMLGLNRQYDRAIEQGRLALEVVPWHVLGNFAIGTIYHGAGRFDEAIVTLRKAAELTGGAPLMLGWLGLALADSGDRTAARALLDRLDTMPPDVYVPASSRAWIHLGLGDFDEFFDWMDQAIEERDHLIMATKSYRFLDRIRGDARYTRLLRKMHLD